MLLTFFSKATFSFLRLYNHSPLSHSIHLHSLTTGFDPVTCTRTPNKRYAYRYADFQRLLLKEDMEQAEVIDTRVVARSDCWDGLCHMNPKGHRKIADKVIKDLNFVVLK